MRVFYSVDDLPRFTYPVVTVGSYDGVHYGHRVLLSRVKALAASTSGESIVVTFWPHPRQVLPDGGNIRLLNTLDEKLYLLQEAGIENTLVLPFTAHLAGLTAQEFLESILVDRIGVRRLVVGYNHRFGSDRKGDYDFLCSRQSCFGFTAERVERRDIHAEKVSSTVIRHLIEAGEMHKAGEFLTRGYIVLADVDGSGIVDIADYKLMPPAGRYPVSVTCGGSIYDDTLVVSDNGTTVLENGAKGARRILITFS